LLAALPAAAAPTSFGGKVFPLKPVGASNEYGTVALKPLGEQTAVEVHVVNVPPGVVQTVHIHHGTCAKVDRRIVYPLSPLVDGASDSIVDAPLATILATPSVVHVHSSYKNEHRSLACANLNPL
jgi:hypothetical protein